MTKKISIRPSILSLKVINNLLINKKGITIKALANNLKTDYKNVYDSVDALFKQGIIKKENIGNYNLCRLNYFSDNLIEYLKEFNYYIKLKRFRKKYAIEYNILRETIENMLMNGHVNPLFICLIFGSYSVDEEKDSSDIDILVLSAKESEGVNFRKVLNKINAPYQKKFHIESQQINYFIKDIREINKLTIASELYKYPPIVLHGEDIFFKIIIEANKLW